MTAAYVSRVSSAYELGKHAGGYNVGAFACIAGVFLLARPWWNDAILVGLALYSWFKATEASELFYKLKNAPAD